MVKIRIIVFIYLSDSYIILGFGILKDERGGLLNENIKFVFIGF